MTDNFGSRPGGGRSLQAQDGEALPEALDRLRRELGELQASRKRLVQAADAERRTLERDLHEGVQQQLVGLAVNVQLATQLVDADPSTARALLVELERDVQQALDEAGRLAQRIYPPSLEASGLTAALRAAASGIGIPISVKVEAATGCPPEVLRTVYMCCLETLEHADAEARAAVTVRKEQGAIAFEVVKKGGREVAARGHSDAGLDRLRDRVEALGGWLTFISEPRGTTRLSGSLPLPR
jgi:signal transduction histidine kinase